MITLQLLPFVISAGLSALAVLCRCFDDNLLQRIGLSFICAGSVLTLFVIAKGHPDTAGTIILLGYGLAIFGIGTVVEYKRKSLLCEDQNPNG